jgi:hypothetical protein
VDQRLPAGIEVEVLGTLTEVPPQHAAVPSNKAGQLNQVHGAVSTRHTPADVTARLVRVVNTIQNYTSVFSSSPGVPVQLWRSLAVAAGVHSSSTTARARTAQLAICGGLRTPLSSVDVS